jgi:hypothetical protein
VELFWGDCVKSKVSINIDTLCRMAFLAVRTGEVTAHIFICSAFAIVVPLYTDRSRGFTTEGVAGAYKLRGIRGLPVKK